MDYNGEQLKVPALPPRRGHDLPASPATPTGAEWFSGSGSFAEAIAAQTVSDYIEAFRERKWLLAGLLAAGLVIGLGVILPKPLTYSSNVSVEIQGINENFMGLAQVDPQASGGIYSASATNILTQVEILNSASLRRRASERLEREMIPMLPPQGTGLAGAFNLVRGALGFNPANPLQAMQDAIRSATARARAQAVEGTRIVRITSDSTNPEVASEFLNVLVAEYTEQSLEDRARSSKTTNLWLESQMREQKQRLEEAETRLKEFVAQSGLEGLTQQDQGQGQGLTLADAKMLTLQRELAGIQADRILRQSRYETALKSTADDMPEGIASAGMVQLRGNLVDLEKQLADLLTTFTDNHPKVVRVKAQIADARKALEKEREEMIGRLKTDLEAARRREQLLAGSFSAQTGQVRGQADKTLKYNLLKREVESSRQVYNSILQQANQAGIATAVPTLKIRVVDPAAPNLKPSLRNVYVGGGLGLLTGLLLGAILAVLLHRGEMRFHKPGEPVAVLNLPELGVIPSGGLFESRRGLLRLKRTQRALAAGNGDGAPDSVEVITCGERPTLLAESFRAVLTSLLFSAGAGPRRMVTITSPNPQDGKSTVASNLAAALAEMGRQVLLVDADLRKPKLHVIFNLENTWGLADLLEDQTAVSAYPREAFYREAGTPNLFVLPSGPPLKHVGALIHSERFAQLLERFRQEFDYVFLDTPPVLLVADARVTGQRSDGVILVLRAGQTLHVDAMQAVQRLKEDGTRVIGTILNHWTPPPMGRSYYKRYYEYYRPVDD